MSQPRSISISPTKSAFRRPSAQRTPTFRSLLPSPHFDNEPLPEIHRSPSGHDYDHAATIEEEADQPQDENQAFQFQPFFTLIHDNITNEHYHPTVHYIFADDDAEIITEAALRSLEYLDVAQRPPGPSESNLQNVKQQEEESEEPRLPRRQPGVHEHYLILDVQSSDAIPEGPKNPAFRVVKAQSLSSEWQISQTNITNAPTIGEEMEDDNLMLRIEGRGNTPPEYERDNAKDTETLEEMVEKFQRRLKDIRLLLDTPEVEGSNLPDTMDQF